MEGFRKLLAHTLSIAVNELEIPPERERGDFAFPCFRLAKELKKNPAEVAKDLVASINPRLDLQRFSVAAEGPYINFSLTDWALVHEALDPILNLSPNDPLGAGTRETPTHWIFEYSSPNVAKPFQIYHLRTTIVGSSLSKIAKLRGYQVTSINHLGDWGTQYGKLAIALDRYRADLPTVPTLKDLVTAYIRIHADMETDPSIEKAGQEAFRKLEAGDPELLALWKKCVDISIREFKKIYAIFDVQFDHYWGESFYEPELKPLLQDLKNRKIAIQDQGAWIVPVQTRDQKEIPPCMVEKSDGASIYASRDIAAALYRKRELKFDRMTYVVGKEQKLHFDQVFGVLRAMKLDWEPQCEHLATGLYRFKDAKMSTRKGNFITLEEVLNLCEEKSLALMSTRNAELDPEQRLSELDLETISKQVAIGALIFADLSTDPSKDLDFDIDRVISFEGETGPYLQYAHTRCASILRKAETAGFRPDPKSISGTLAPAERDLIRRLASFETALDRTLDQRKPSQLCHYLIDVAKDFGFFYRECKVIDPENPPQTQQRLNLILATQRVLSTGLSLLGMPLPQKM